MREPDAKLHRIPWLLFLTGIGCLILLNFYVLLGAYSFSLATICCTGSKSAARDFSAYYAAIWQMLHVPSQIYAHGPVLDGGPVFYPTNEQYKYLPSFLILILPFDLLGYAQAIVAFDAFQFALLPSMALLIYKLVREKGLGVTFAVAAAVLLLPVPWHGWNISVPYFWLWKEGQAKVLETFLLLTSFHFGKTLRPSLSGATLALAFYDPRFGLVALPLFVMYNRGAIRLATFWFAGTLLVSNALFLYPGVAAGYFDMAFTTGVATFFYPYAFIPLLAVACLWYLNRKQVESALRDVAVSTKAYLLERLVTGP